MCGMIQILHLSQNRDPHFTLATLYNCQCTACRWEHTRTHFHPVLPCLELPAQEEMKFAENLTDARITCSWPSLAAPYTCLVSRAWRASSTFSPNGIFCWKEVGDSNELQTFPWNGELPKKAIAAKQAHGNHDISLNSEPNLPFFFFIETFCVPCALGAKKKSYFGSLFHFTKLRYCKYPPLLS